MAQTLRIERRLGDWMRARLPHRLAEFVMFVLKQGWAALFGGLFLIAITGTAAVWRDDWALARYDALFLFAATVAIFWRTRIWFFIGENVHWMPLPLAAFLSAFFLWLAENVGTGTGTWAYAGQSAFEWVRWGKLGSWYLLLYVSFLLVTLVFRDGLYPRPIVCPSPRPEPEAAGS